MGVLFGLAAAVCWGGADFLITPLTRRIGAAQAMFYLQAGGLLTTGGLLLARPGAPASSVSIWAFTVGISIVNMIGTLLLYRAFAIGTLALVSPIASGFAVVTALLALAAGERPAPTALLGALLLIGGVAVVSRTPGQREPAPLAGNRAPGAAHAASPSSANYYLLFPAGVPEAVGVVFCFGFYFWALDLVTPALGILWPVLATRAVELVAALLILAGRRTMPARLSRAAWGLALLAALFDTLAFVAFNMGIGSAYTTIVTALASLFSAVTVLLAWVFLRERLSAGQWVGVLSILAGVLLVTI